MTSYDDMLNDTDAIVYMGKYDKNASKANDVQAGFKLWNYALKAAPKKNISVAHNYTTEAKFDAKKLEST